MLTEVPNQQYVVMLKGVAASAPMATERLAEAFIMRMPLDQQPHATIVPIVEGSNKQLLLG